MAHKYFNSNHAAIAAAGVSKRQYGLSFYEQLGRTGGKTKRVLKNLLGFALIFVVMLGVIYAAATWCYVG